MTVEKPLSKQGNKVWDGDIFLGFRLHIAHSSRTFCHLVIAEENGVASSQAISLPEMSLE